jgi:hypothetical protein
VSLSSGTYSELRVTERVRFAEPDFSPEASTAVRPPACSGRWKPDGGFLQGYPAGTVVVARAARALVGDIEPTPLQLGGINPCRRATCIRNSGARRPSEVTYPTAFRSRPGFIADEDALLLGEELQDRLAVPAIRAPPAGPLRIFGPS